MDIRSIEKKTSLLQNLQIGANTMDNPNDPLAAHLDKYSAHRKVFVEPVPPLYNRLRKNLVAMPNTTFINAAVSNKTEGVHWPLNWMMPKVVYVRMPFRPTVLSLMSHPVIALYAHLIRGPPRSTSPKQG